MLVHKPQMKGGCYSSPLHLDAKLLTIVFLSAIDR